jgi:hypothetical protein
MIFLIDKENKLILQTNKIEEAKNIVLSSIQQFDNNIYEVIGTRNIRIFKMIYSEYKGYKIIKITAKGV